MTSGCVAARANGTGRSMWSLRAEALAERFPSLIPCSISGYGSSGPWADRKAFARNSTSSEDLSAPSVVNAPSVLTAPQRLGIFGLAIPEEYGGTLVTVPCLILITEELARGWMSLAGAMGGHTVVAKLLVQFGNEEQKRRYLPKMATGETRATMALTEPGGGSDLQAMRTTGHQGISVLLVGHGPGLTVSRDLPKLGYKGVESCELSFDDHRAPADAVLGRAEGKGFAQMMKGLETGWLQVAVASNAARIHGGYGYSTEFDVERYFRDAPLVIVGEGTNEIQRNVIASQLVKRGGLDV